VYLHKFQLLPKLERNLESCQALKSCYKDSKGLLINLSLKVGCPAVRGPAVGGPAVGVPAVTGPAVGSPVGVLGKESLIQSVTVTQESRQGFQMDVRNLLSKKRKKAVAGPAMVLRGLRIKMSSQRAQSVARAKKGAKARSLRQRRVEAKGVRSNL
jgi:hypothetical protein